MTKRYNEAIEVEMGKFPAPQPVAFLWRGRRYCVSRLLKYWREATEVWDPERIKDHECFRVEAEGGTYDLRVDRSSQTASKGSWRLARMWD